MATPRTHETGPPVQDASAANPVEQRAIEVRVAVAFRAAVAERLGPSMADEVFRDAVVSLAEQSANERRAGGGAPTLADLWEVWVALGADGRLDLILDELTEHRLRFHVDRCAYAERYREMDLEAEGVQFSCGRDASFAEAFLPGVRVDQSRSILEGAPRCEFTYTLEES